MEEWSIDQWNKERTNTEQTALFVYTTMCGTCQVAEKMLAIIQTMRPNLRIGKINVQFASQLVEQYKIESVPCLLVEKQGNMEQKLYAFQSVPYLLEIFDKKTLT
ncbi:thioredoxin family protein [Paenisporosarcina cavernae]|uniref:Thioredoxin n=1 Tax=Paenisporosarcina cavernae TaxID=2320858 RepID=A0A385YUT9_9BACL|nr:thioredoxin family protein [Paenisporosarcina cavernae]AYC30050.1 thioredoxin [Paenisporosarcina cavernae]